MDRELSTIMLIEKEYGPSVTNQHKPYQKLSSIKKRPCCQFGGLQRRCVCSAASKQPNHQLRCLLPTTCEIGESDRREKAIIGK